ncbi:uncharacterized protein SCHCODRAFT_02378282 [Schizophyllum commune H4-8]|uniref:uncharacterized protein n=1 Tax=Schizophyllum commune (strain H4-8 / FGSC 9210) TaxID=578458 RepID=UPI00215E01EF|nr:uncharacterized protein SCHCODRAFT_02378282 [Schizophyllum commune H4-8]KAI5889811.1 hypothetical protein SCHCODRAFT_02378282 [Schizophyllum commune H4-8]
MTERIDFSPPCGSACGGEHDRLGLLSWGRPALSWLRPLRSWAGQRCYLYLFLCAFRLALGCLGTLLYTRSEAAIFTTTLFCTLCMTPVDSIRLYRTRIFCQE